MCGSKSVQINFFQRLKIVALLVSGVTLLAGCVTTQTASRQIDRLEVVGENPRILLMPPDIRYYMITAGGVTEPNAELTEAARQNFLVSMKDFADSIGADLVTIDDPEGLSDAEEQYRKLHSAVGITLQINHFGIMPLPTKNLPDNQRRFDWSLGPDVSEIGGRYNADYLLFVYYRDYQATGGRIAFAILAAAAGVGVSAGSESGFASLVDLRTGDIVWFNSVAIGGGELSNPTGAAAAVSRLFADIPTN